ncbi:CoA transferase [Actinomycetospora sp.]|uniref:CoA transferase n=1 Tax=Actinomycetospora sp. TaxID=1872135 RepID=UPI002F3EF799
MNEARDVALHDLWARLDAPGPPPHPIGRGDSTGLASPLPVDALAHASVASAAGAAALLRGGGEVEVDAARVGSSFRADQLLRIHGEASGGFAPLSGFWRAGRGERSDGGSVRGERSDGGSLRGGGWVRTHANYPHHRARLLAALGLPDDSGPDELTAALATRSALEVEDAVTAAGGIAVAVRDRTTWSSSGPGRAVAGEPLVTVRRAGGPGPAVGDRFRVLDLTRVIAGPVATRTLALAGADVLRVDPPHLAEIPAQHADTGLGKRTTILDAADPRLRALADTADVVVTGYRPGALDRFGLAPEDLLERRPDLVVVRLDAWGWTGPWAGRRGFDSIEQAASGIAVACADPTREDGRPGALPAQALDHATGYLAAASALLGLAERSERGGSVRDLALARTAEWLWSGPVGGLDDANRVPAVEPLRQSVGAVEVPPPAVVMPGGPASWAAPAHRLGTDEPAWAPR